MQDNEVTFKCGQKAFIEMVFGRVSYASARSFRAVEIAQSVIHNDLARAQAYLEESVWLIDPHVELDDDGSCGVPPYWCAVKLWTVSENADYRYCSVQWYQNQLVPDISGLFREWAASISWIELIDALRLRVAETQGSLRRE